MVGARDRLLPPQLSRVSKRTQTPVTAQLFMGAIICELLGSVGAGMSVIVPQLPPQLGQRLPDRAALSAGS